MDSTSVIVYLGVMIQKPLIPEWRDDAAEEYIARRGELLRKWEEVEEQRERLSRFSEEIQGQIARLDFAASVFGLDKVLTFDPSKTESPPLPLEFDDDPVDGSAFKDVALNFLTNIHPRGAKAADVRSFVEQQLQQEFHEKTAGMTLYRLSKRGVVRREGVTWFWVPPTQRGPEFESKRGKIMF